MTNGLCLGGEQLETLTDQHKDKDNTLSITWMREMTDIPFDRFSEAWEERGDIPQKMSPSLRPT